jgi:hypothetical protein
VSGAPNEFDAMTVNERLFVAGLLDEFGAAARRRDRETMIELLTRVAVARPEWSVDSILKAPERYGF